MRLRLYVYLYHAPKMEKLKLEIFFIWIFTGFLKSHFTHISSCNIFSEAAFKAMDRNKDGYITKGELKLAKKKMSMKEVDQTIKDYDLDNDGKLNYEEFLKSQ